ncbi:MAG: OmpW family outer membrane protein [Pseudomonadota bacterium]
MRKFLLSASLIVLTAVPAYAEEGSWLVRGRVIDIIPDEGGTVSAPLGGSVNIDDAIVPELDFTYFFTDNIAAELILATAEHDVEATTGPTDLGSIWLLPPTLTLQYHFNGLGKAKPYVGAGVNYTIFYNADEPAGLDIDYDDGFGWALQAGVDVFVNDNWFVNLDIKKLFLGTDVSINGGAITADVDIDPWVVGVGGGFKF